MILQIIFISRQVKSSESKVLHQKVKVFQLSIAVIPKSIICYHLSIMLHYVSIQVSILVHQGSIVVNIVHQAPSCVHLKIHHCIRRLSRASRASFIAKARIISRAWFCRSYGRLLIVRSMRNLLSSLGRSIPNPRSSRRRFSRCCADSPDAWLFPVILAW